MQQKLKLGFRFKCFADFYFIQSDTSRLCPQTLGLTSRRRSILILTTRVSIMDDTVAVGFFFGIAVESGVCVVVVSSSSSLWFNSVPTSQSHDGSFMERLATPTCGEE